MTFEAWWCAGRRGRMPRRSGRPIGFIGGPTDAADPASPAHHDHVMKAVSEPKERARMKGKQEP